MKLTTRMIRGTEKAAQEVTNTTGWKRDANHLFNTDLSGRSKLDIMVTNFTGTKKEYNALLDRLQAFLKAEKV